MPGFGFYTDCFMGELIPEADFQHCACRAQAALADFRSRYRVSGDETGEKMAICAMAEAVYAARQNPGITATTVGSVSVKYGTQDTESLYRIARGYLNIYRGVG